MCLYLCSRSPSPFCTVWLKSGHAVQGASCMQLKHVSFNSLFGAVHLLVTAVCENSYKTSCVCQISLQLPLRSSRVLCPRCAVVLRSIIGSDTGSSQFIRQASRRLTLLSFLSPILHNGGLEPSQRTRLEQRWITIHRWRTRSRKSSTHLASMAAGLTQHGPVSVVLWQSVQ